MSPYSNAPFSIKKQKRSHSPKFFFAIFILIAIAIAWFVLRTSVPRGRNFVPPIYPDVVQEAFHSKRALISKVTELETTIQSFDARLSELAVLKDENQKLKAELERYPDQRGILAHVLTLPNRSFYDTLGIDAGIQEGVQAGATAYAFGNIAIGTVSYADEHSAVIELFSAPNREITGTVSGSDVAVTMIGRGGGEYEVRIPRDIKFEIGTMVVHQQVQTALLAQIEKIATDPRDPFQRLYAKAPVNLQALKWVIIR